MKKLTSKIMKSLVLSITLSAAATCFAVIASPYNPQPSIRGATTPSTPAAAIDNPETGKVSEENNKQKIKRDIAANVLTQGEPAPAPAPVAPTKKP